MINTIEIKERIKRVVPDDIYLKYMFYKILKKKLNLNNPKSFNEKLQWLKLNNRKSIYTTMVDKYEVKKFVASKIGDEYIIPTYGVWDTFDDINFSLLPNSFVLKCNHDSGGVAICRNKKDFDFDNAKIKINDCLHNNFYYNGREWPYKNVKPKIIAEKLMQEKKAEELIDYKFFCFNGVPKFLFVSQGCKSHETGRTTPLTLDWKKMPISRNDYKEFEELPSKPANFNKMVEISRELSSNIPFLRVDLYNINNRIYFSEFTFFPCSGFMPFSSDEQDLYIGNMLSLT